MVLFFLYTKIDYYTECWATFLNSLSNTLITLKSSCKIIAHSFEDSLEK